MTLESISVTPPTKTEYTTDDTQLDLTGMVVTAHYSDQSEQVIEAGYTVSNEDFFSTTGTKTVTVTYEGKTDSFQITVIEAIQSLWPADVVSLFRANLYNYVLPYFDSVELGLGELTWKANDGAVYALGGDLAAPTGNTFLFTKVYTALRGDKFSVKQTATTSDKGSPYYIMEKSLDVNGVTHYLRAQFGAVNIEKGTFEKSGKFYFEIYDAYVYSWAESGLEDLIKTSFEIEDDIPDLPDPVRILERETDKDFYEEKGYIEFTNVEADADYGDAYIDALEAAEWTVFTSARDDFVVDAIPKTKSIRLGIGFDSKKGLTLRFDRLPTLSRPYLNLVADALEIPGSGYAFAYSSKYDQYSAFITGVEPDEGRTTDEAIGDFIDAYAAKLLAADLGFAKKGDRTGPQTSSNFRFAYDKYESVSLAAVVSIVAVYNSTSKTYYMEIDIEDYVEFPAVFTPVVELLGLSPDQFNIEAATLTTGVSVWTQIAFQEGQDLDSAMKAYTDLLDADNTFGFVASLPAEACTMSSGDEGRHAIYVCDGFKVELYTFDGRVQISISEYSLPPESEWANLVIAAFAEVNLPISWDSDAHMYDYANYRQLGDGESLVDFVNNLADSLMQNAALNALGELEEIYGTGNTDPGEVVTILYCDYGAIFIKYSSHYGDDPVLFVRVYVFADGTDAVANAVGVVMSVSVTENEPGVYSGYGYFNWVDTHNLKAEGKTLLELNIGKTLEDADALGFTLVESSSKYVEDPNGNYYVGQYTNEDGYVVTIKLFEDANGDYNGNYELIIEVPE